MRVCLPGSVYSHVPQHEQVLAPILQRMNLRFREAELPAEGHTAGRQRWDNNASLNTNCGVRPWVWHWGVKVAGETEGQWAGLPGQV